MKTAVNADKSAVSAVLGSDGKPIEKQNEKTPVKNNSKKQTSGKSKKKTDGTGEERTHKKYKTTINLSALKEMEGTTASSFLDLASAVILIDNKEYDKEYLALSKERKNDFKRLIEHYAVIDVIVADRASWPKVDQRKRPKE